jgi:GalNAc-alpha-(1->4)-GalNAc-alpha-(1->3)-diNAcBac-PP-undecaprenol alpha-1,4-N-acetyl-D-galactosaminyltransferase
MVFILADLESGGTQRVVTSLANYWADQGRDISVITFSDPESDFFKLSPEVQRHSIGGQQNSGSFLTGLVANFQRIKALRRVLATLNLEVAIAFIAHTNILAVIAGFGLKTRILISERNDFRQQSVGRIWDLFRRIVYPMADLVTANSKEVVAALGSFVPETKLAFLPNPVAVLNHGATAPAKKNIIIAVGRLHPQKAHNVLIDAFSRIEADHPDWTLEILGEGSERPALEKQISGNNLENCIFLRGRVTNVGEHLLAAKIFVMPSRFEGTPNALLEALSTGLPSIVSDATAGGLEYVSHGENGYIFPVDDAEALGTQLKTLIEDSEIREKFSLSAKARVEGLSLSNIAETWDRTIWKT